MPRRVSGSSAGGLACGVERGRGGSRHPCSLGFLRSSCPCSPLQAGLCLGHPPGGGGETGKGWEVGGCGFWLLPGHWALPLVGAFPPARPSPRVCGHWGSATGLFSS